MDTTREIIAPPPKLLWRETLTRLRAYKGVQRKGKIEPFDSRRNSLSMGKPIQLLRNSIPSSTVSPLQPCHQNDVPLGPIPVPDVSNAVYEKDNQLLVLPFPTDVITQRISEKAVNHGKYQQEKQQQRSYYHQHQQIKNESLVNKSFRKIIHLSRATTWMIPKAIATATSSVSLPAHSTHKPLSLEAYSNTSDLIPLRLPSFDEFSKGSDLDQLSSFRQEINATGTQNSLSNKKIKYFRKNLRFNVHQITSLTSARDLEYELLVKVNQETVAVRYGQMKKLAKGISSCSLPEDWLSLKVDGSFELTITINTKPTRPYKMADYLARRGLWPLRLRRQRRQPQEQHQQQQQSDQVSTSHSSCWSSSSEETTAAVVLPSLTSLQSMTTTDLPSSTSPSSGMIITGYLDLSSGDDMDQIENGQHRYRLTKPQSTKHSSYTATMDIEVLVEFLWQARRPSDREVIRPSASNKGAPTSLTYPWLRYPEGALPPMSPDIENEEKLLADKDAVHAAMTHTTQGDHLTFYLHNLVSPKWERYWVMVKNKRLLILSTVYKNKAPIYDIPLDLLTQVSKPTEEDQEYVCLNRQVGIVIQLNVDSNNSNINTALGNRIYISADTAIFALHWIRALTVIKANNQVQSIP
ncbi:unnamed protein product [Absidia cylindrospora]